MRYLNEISRVSTDSEDSKEKKKNSNEQKVTKKFHLNFITTLGNHTKVYLRHFQLKANIHQQKKLTLSRGKQFFHGKQWDVKALVTEFY